MRDLFKALQTKLTDRESLRVEKWKELVVAVADGQAVDPDEAGTLLDESGHSPEDLRSEVEQLIERRRLAEVAATLPDALKGRNEARKRTQKLHAKKKAAEQKLYAEIEASEADERRHNAVVTAANDAKKRLLDTAVHAVRSRLCEIDTELTKCDDPTRKAELTSEQETLNQQLLEPAY